MTARQAAEHTTEGAIIVRTAIATIAVVGTLLAALGVLLTTSWMILIGAAAIVLAMVVGRVDRTSAAPAPTAAWLNGGPQPRRRADQG
jgi:hypothetical protein